MPDPDARPLTDAERPDAERPVAARDGSSAVRRSAAVPRDDQPTVRSAPALGSQPGSSVTPGGSSARRVTLVDGPAPEMVGLPLPLPLPLPRPGERIDIFELEEAIGVGGMGAVFRAHDTRLDRHVALKILPPEQARDPEVVQRFYQEGQAAARLDHENIARVYSIGYDGRVHFIAFEYIEGTTVRQRVERQGPLPVGEAINYTLQIADALVHAAERAVVHRDIKPSNIIVTPHGRAKIVDMGLARRFERGGDDGLTQSGMTLGTFDYISPEQARDPRDVDVRSDLYSLGCTLFHMLTGRPPFPDGTVLQKLIQHQEEPPPEIRELNPAVPPDLANILTKLMAKDRDRRYQVPEQLVRDLLTVAGAMGLRSVSPEGLVWLSSEPASRWARHLVWGVPAAVFAMIVAALVWTGQDAGRSATVATPPTVDRVRVRDSVDAGPTRVAATSADAAGTPLTAADESSEPVPTEAPPPAPREMPVFASDDLAAKLASAPPRAVIVLTGDGPFVLGRGDRPAGPVPDRELTIKAEAGGRPPVLRAARDLPGDGNRPQALLDFAGGHVTLDDLIFDLDAAEGDGPLAAVRTEGTDLTVRRCVFRRAGGTLEGSDSPRPTALFVRGPSTGVGEDERPAAVRVERCHFDGGQTGVRASGPSDLFLRDCTFAGAEPVVWLDNGRAASSVAAELRLRHVSVLAGEGPVFRFEGTVPHVEIDDSVISPAAEGEKATLVATDLPDAMVWHGRHNLYGRVDTFLLPTDGRLGREPLRDPARWQETPEVVREVATEVVPGAVWDGRDPAAQAASQVSENPSRMFQLAVGDPGPGGVGAHQGPFGAVPAPARVMTVSGRATARPKAARPETRAASGPSRTGDEPVAAAAPVAEGRADQGRERSARTGGAADSPASAPPASGAESGMDDLPEMPVMPPTGPPAAPASPPQAPRERENPAGSDEAAGAGPDRAGPDRDGGLVN